MNMLPEKDLPGALQRVLALHGYGSTSRNMQQAHPESNTQAPAETSTPWTSPMPYEQHRQSNGTYQWQNSISHKPQQWPTLEQSRTVASNKQDQHKNTNAYRLSSPASGNVSLNLQQRQQSSKQLLPAIHYLATLCK